MDNPLGQLFCPLVCAQLRNFGIASSLSLLGRSGLLWFCFGGINLGMAHPLGEIFCPLV